MIGTILTSSVIAAIVGAIVGIWKSRRDAFIKTVTTVRKDYIKEFRKLAADFVHTAFLLKGNPYSYKHKQRLYKIGVDIKLRLNPIEYSQMWDGYIVSEVDKIVKWSNRQDGDIQIDTHIVRFIALSQSLLALEWTGMMTEGRGGNLSRREKWNLRLRFWRQYKITVDE